LEKHTPGHYVLGDGSPEEESTLLQSHNSEKSILVPTPSEDELMANLEWDEEDLEEYPEVEEGGITIVAAHTLERDMQAELSPIVCDMPLNCSFTGSSNTERYV
jgi:hypothetical protein